MKIRKGTFKIREGAESIIWVSYEGSYGHDFPFYVHRKTEQKHWTLSHLPTGYAIRRNISLKNARGLAKALKEWPIFLMPTVETLVRQKSLLPTFKQEELNRLVHNYGE